MDDLDELDSIIDTIDDSPAANSTPTVNVEDDDLEDLLNSLDSGSTAAPAPVAHVGRARAVSDYDFGIDLANQPSSGHKTTTTTTTTKTVKTPDPRVSSLDFGLNDLQTTKSSPKQVDPRVSSLDFGLNDLQETKKTTKPIDPRVSSLDFGLDDLNAPKTTTHKSTSNSMTSTPQPKKTPKLPSKSGVGNVSLSSVNPSDSELDDILSDLQNDSTTTTTSSSSNAKPSSSSSSSSLSSTPSSSTTTTTTTTTNSSSSSTGLHPNAARGNRNCGKCGQHLPTNVASTEADGIIYHPDCFTCQKCGRPILNTFMIVDGRPQCGTCSETIRCAKCNQMIDGTYMEQDGRKMHAACAGVSGCGKCGGALTGNIVTAGNQRYHQRCFVCANCNVALNSYMETGGKILCTSCGQKANSMSCAECGNQLTGEYLTLKGRSMCPGCFKCAKCRISLGSSKFYEVNGSPHCASCAGQ